jgi:hypothetical protein
MTEMTERRRRARDDGAGAHRGPGAAAKTAETAETAENPGNAP